MGCITKHYLNKETVIGVWKIEEDLEYPGQIKVNMIRESRAVDFAK